MVDSTPMVSQKGWNSLSLLIYVLALDLFLRYKGFSLSKAGQLLYSQLLQDQHLLGLFL